MNKQYDRTGSNQEPDAIKAKSTATSTTVVVIVVVATKTQSRTPGDETPVLLSCIAPHSMPILGIILRNSLFVRAVLHLKIQSNSLQASEHVAVLEVCKALERHGCEAGRVGARSQQGETTKCWIVHAVGTRAP